MTPYQRFAWAGALDPGDHLPEWRRTAAVLRVWANREKALAISERKQAEAICTHIVQGWGPAALDANPEMRGYAAELRAVPCYADLRVEHVARSVKTAVGAGDRFPPDVVRVAATEAAWDIAYESVRLMSSFSSNTAIQLARRAAIWGVSTLPDPRAAFAPAAESWIALALPPVRPAPLIALGVMDFSRAPAEEDAGAYAVAWDALGGNLPTDGTDDGIRVRDGLDGDGNPVPLWARRTALARCLVRLELSR